MYGFFSLSKIIIKIIQTKISCLIKQCVLNKCLSDLKCYFKDKFNIIDVYLIQF